MLNYIKTDIIKSSQKKANFQIFSYFMKIFLIELESHEAESTETKQFV